MLREVFVLCSAILVSSTQIYPPTPGYIPYGYGHPFYRQLSLPYVQPYMHSVGQQHGFAPSHDYYGNNDQAEIIDVSPEVFREEMRKLGILQDSWQGEVSNIQPHFNYADQIPPNNALFSYPPLPAGPHYQRAPYNPRAPSQSYSYGPPYDVSESRMVPKMVYIPVNNTYTQGIQDPQIPSFPYTQVPAQTYTPSVGHVHPEFTYIPTYQYKNQPAPPIAKKRRHRHRYVIKKDSSQNNGNQSESRVIDKHEVQRKTYSFRKTFVVTPEKRPSGPITINLLNGVPITTSAPEETIVTTIPTTTTEDNEIPEDITGFANVFDWKP